MLEGRAAPANDGIDRATHFRVLEEFELKIPLIVLQSCSGGRGLVPGDLPAAIASVAAAPGQIDYRDLDFSELGARPVEDLIDQIRARSNMVLVMKGRSPRTLRLLPLVVTLGVWFYYYRKRRVPVVAATAP